jgi:hypothetical protein
VRRAGRPGPPDIGENFFLGSLAAVALLVLLHLAGPLPVIYRTPNNFMNHSNFQSDNKRRALELTEVQQARCSRLYRDLRDHPDVTTIIEAPFITQRIR